jgi:hydrogenase/urease accessory protein HupE
MFVVGMVPAQVFAHASSLPREFPRLPEYLWLGVEHILTGYDHLAFLLGLVLMLTRLRPVFAAVTAFTVGHSLSLAASCLGVLSLPSRGVETAIAISIAYVAAENLRARRVDSRWLVSFAFGFVHGFGFAGALQEIGVPEERAALALAAFNAGVELGQLAVLAVVLPCLAALRRRPALGSRAPYALNHGLLCVGLGLAGERARFDAPEVAASNADAAVSSLALAPDAQQLRAAESVCELAIRARRLRAACLHEAPGLELVRACTAALADAQARGALSIATEEFPRCAAEAEAAATSCELRGPFDSAACQSILRGRLPAENACLSSWECSPGLSCRGVSPTEPGRCGAAESHPQPDALSIYLR